MSQIYSLLDLHTDARLQVLHSVLWLWVRFARRRGDCVRVDLVVCVSDTQVRLACMKVRLTMCDTTYSSDGAVDYYVRVYLTNETSSTISCVPTGFYIAVSNLTQRPSGGSEA